MLTYLVGSDVAVDELEPEAGIEPAHTPTPEKGNNRPAMDCSAPKSKPQIRPILENIYSCHPHPKTAEILSILQKRPVRPPFPVLADPQNPICNKICYPIHSKKR